MESSLWKKGLFENYKSIARDHGSTVAKLKTLLESENLLCGKMPTETALQKNIAVLETIESARFGLNRRVLWHIPTLREIFARKSIKPLEGDERLLHIENLFQAVNRIEIVAGRLTESLELKYNGSAPSWMIAKFGKKAAQNLHDKAIADLTGARIDSKLYLSFTDSGSFCRQIDRHFEAALNLGVERGDEPAQAVEVCREILKTVCRWVTTKKLERFRRVVRKERGNNLEDAQMMPVENKKRSDHKHGVKG